VYELAASGSNSGNVNAFLATQTLTLGTNGLISMTTIPTTTQAPLPAAVWLLGSGLLGLIGVGRRRRAA